MKKPSLAIVIGMGKKPKMGESDADESEGMEYSEEQTMMAEELIDAVKSGDAKALLEAFHGLFEACEMMSHEEMDEAPSNGKMKVY